MYMNPIGLLPGFICTANPKGGFDKKYSTPTAPCMQIEGHAQKLTYLMRLRSIHVCVVVGVWRK